MNISSMSSTQSLWKFQMNVSSQASSAKAPSKGADAGKAVEELLDLLGNAKGTNSTGSSEAPESSQTSTGAENRNHNGPPPLDLMNGRIALGLSASGGSGKAQESSTKEFSKEDLANLKSAIEQKGQKVSQGLTKLISEFDSTDSDQNGKVSKQEVMAFAEKNGFSVPPAIQAAGLENAGSSTSYGNTFSGFSKDDLSAIKDTLEKGMQAISNAFQSILNSFSKGDANQSGGLDLQELQSLMGSGETSSAAGSQGGQPAIEIRFRPQQGGEKGLSKDDLIALKKTLEDNGIEVPDELDNLIESFDKVDSNKDGALGKDEVKAFRETGASAIDSESSSSASSASAASGASSGAEAGESSASSLSASFNRLLSQQMAKAYSSSSSFKYESFQASYQANLVG